MHGLIALVTLFAATDSPTLAGLAAEADVVAIVRVEDTDYEYARGFPRSGFALLRVLIGYKGANSGDLIEVPEEGLDDDACYFPQLGLFQVEGRRFLTFLKRKGKDSYIGTAPTCRLPVLVTAQSAYALLYPIDGATIESPETVVETLSFADPAAYVDGSDLTSERLRELVEDYGAERVDNDPLTPRSETYVYTRGIPMPKLRALMADGLGETRARSRR